MWMVASASRQRWVACAAQVAGVEAGHLGDAGAHVGHGQRGVGVTGAVGQVDVAGEAGVLVVPLELAVAVDGGHAGVGRRRLGDEVRDAGDRDRPAGPVMVSVRSKVSSVFWSAPRSTCGADGGWLALHVDVHRDQLLEVVGDLTDLVVEDVRSGEALLGLVLAGLAEVGDRRRCWPAPLMGPHRTWPPLLRLGAPVGDAELVEVALAGRGCSGRRRWRAPGSDAVRTVGQVIDGLVAVGGVDLGVVGLDDRRQRSGDGPGPADVQVARHRAGGVGLVVAGDVDLGEGDDALGGGLHLGDHLDVGAVGEPGDAGRGVRVEAVAPGADGVLACRCCRSVVGVDVDVSSPLSPSGAAAGSTGPGRLQLEVERVGAVVAVGAAGVVLADRELDGPLVADPHGRTRCRCWSAPSSWRR